MYLLSSALRESTVLNMMGLLIRSGLALLVLNALLTPVDAGSNYGARERSYSTLDESYQDPNNPWRLPKFKFIFKEDTTHKGLGVSAWGIVIIVVAIILAVMGLYYISICYSVCQTSCQPSICQTKTNKYDKMGMPTMA